VYVNPLFVIQYKHTLGRIGGNWRSLELGFLALQRTFAIRVLIKVYV
jgi:hypothetical protein